jgi:hypothetical protein
MVIRWFMSNRSLFMHFDILSIQIVIDFNQKFNCYKVDSVNPSSVTLIGSPPNHVLDEEEMS